MIIKKCKECKNSFGIFPSVENRKGRGTFCSKKCFDKYQCTNGEPGYSAVHQWLIKSFGKADVCDSRLIGLRCRKISSVFEWALIKGCKYQKKSENFIELCKSCHHRYDDMGLRPFKGKKHSKETKRKMRRTWIKRKMNL